MGHEGRSDQERVAEEHAIAARQQRNAILENLPAHIWIQGKDKTVLYSNRPKYQQQLEGEERTFCHKLFMDKPESCKCCPSTRLFSTMCPKKCECMRQTEGQLFYVYHFPFIDVDGSFKVIKFEIDPSKRAQGCLEKELWDDATKYTLTKKESKPELLRMCSNCKNILDKSGRWRQVDSYFKERLDIDFTHGICLQCAKKLYPSIFTGTENR